MRPAPAAIEHGDQAGAAGRVDPVYQGIHELSRAPSEPAVAGNRSPFLTPLLLAGYLVIAPWIFLLAPLAMLLLISRPGTMREWLWIAIALVAGTMLLQPAADLGGLTMRAAGAFFAGAYVALTLAGPRPRSLFVRTTTAVAAAAAATAGWFIALGLRYTELRDAVVATQWKAYRTFLKGLPEAPPPPSLDDLVAGTPTAELARDLSRTVHLVGDLFPALLALSALAAGWLVWVWYHRVARKPIGLAAPAFRDFRFSDHLIWVLLALGGLTLADLPGALDLLSLNLLVVILGIYGARGLAVARTLLLRMAPFLTPLLCLIALPVLPLPLSGLVILGVADTWLDLRRRMPPPEGVVQ